MHFADDLEVQSDSLTELDGDRASDKPLEDILRAIHGDDARQFIGRHHVRYFEKARAKSTCCRSPFSCF